MLSLGSLEGVAVAQVGKMIRNIKERSHCNEIIREEEFMAVDFWGFIVVCKREMMYTNRIFIYHKAKLN